MALLGTSMATPHVCGLLLIDGVILFYDGAAIDDPEIKKALGSFPRAFH